MYLLCETNPEEYIVLLYSAGNLATFFLRKLSLLCTWSRPGGRCWAWKRSLPEAPPGLLSAIVLSALPGGARPFPGNCPAPSSAAASCCRGAGDRGGPPQVLRPTCPQPGQACSEIGLVEPGCGGSRGPGVQRVALPHCGWVPLLAPPGT